MPKISEQHRQKQAEKILVAAETCFARGGFHATSMEQIIAAAGMSSSTVYRYFSGKTEIIQEVSRRRVGPAIHQLQEIVDKDELPPPDQALSTVLYTLSQDAETTGDDSVYDKALLSVNAWAETARDSELAETIQSNLDEVQRTLALLVTRWQSSGQILKSLDAEGIAALLLNFTLGKVAQTAIFGKATLGIDLEHLLELLSPEP